MIYLVPLLTAPLAQNVDAEYKIVCVERTEVFAGKLGRLVNETLTVERDGATYTVKLNGRHTAIHGHHTYREGDSIRLRGSIHDNQIDAR